MSSVATLTAAHLDRAAYVYIRQSSEFQVQNHVERQRLQYVMADHAKELGFHDIEVIDEDLGISGAGVHRPGFDALLEAVCKGRVGLVLSIEASKLSRNGREWHTLLDFCAIVGCLVGDRDRLYDPALIDDRMYLGLKGQFNKWSALHFDILPWIHIPNLGSHILALVRRRVPEDWAERYNTTPVLIETFVETPRYTGAVYRASGWTHVGTTQGRGRYDRHKLYDKPRKDIWLRPLRRDWRRALNR